MSDGLDLVLAFDSDAEEFVRGVEVGMLWNRIEYGDELVIKQTVHAANAEMVMRIAEAVGLTFSATALDDAWVSVTLRRADG